MSDHLRPRARIVVGAVNAHDVHAALERPLDDAGISRRLARHRDHNSHAAVSRASPEDSHSVSAQQLVARVHVQLELGRGRQLLEPVQRDQHGVQRRQHVRLHPPE